MAILPDAIPGPAGLRVIRDPAKRRERLFFGGMSILLAITVFAGFAPSFYLRAFSGSPSAPTPALIWHGVAFSAWMVLLVTQTSLIAARRVDLHRLWA